ncbi:MAG: helix-turn-helix domain-containing protein [Lachnospiraceae bacterium]|nr:helix-turn-helix domain-containing protein [Lachnospiraceae bacterium]
MDRGSRRPELNYYQQNRDFVARTVESRLEKNIFPKGGSIRIWHNEQTDGFEAHWHRALEVIVPIENCYDAVIDQVSYHIVPGDILFIPPRAMHTLIAPESGARFICLFNVEIFDSLRDYVGMQTLLKNPLLISEATHGQLYGDVYSDFVQIWTEYFGDADYYEFSIYSRLLHIFSLLGRHNISTLQPFPELSPDRRRIYYERLGRALDYISKHYTESITLENAAVISGFSKYHFSRLFKAYMNCNFYDYLTDLRIRSAQAMLAANELPITEVALLSGFSSISTFNRTFRQKNGCTPGEYRALFSGRQQYSPAYGDLR